MNTSAIRYTNSDSMIHISKSYNLTCEYDGNKPNQIEIPELNLVLKKGNWLLKIEENFIVCNEESRVALYADIHPILNMKLQTEKRFDMDTKELCGAIADAVKMVIMQEKRQGGLLAENKFTEGGHIKPAYITEMENKINALSTIDSALDCRLNVLSGAG